MKQLNWYQIFGNTHIIPDGKTVTPTDDIQTLLHCANIWDKSYTTISQVIADDDTLFLTLIDNNAIDYLVRSTTFASSIVASESAMQYIGASDYASETLLSDSTWLTAIDGSAYKDYVINASVPTMTSDTAPEGQVLYSTQYNASTYAAWHGFDGNDSSTWSAASGDSNCYIGYKFTRNVKIYKAFVHLYADSAKTIQIRNSADGVTWDDIGSSQTIAAYGNGTFILQPANKLSYWSAKLSAAAGVYTLQFYGRQNGGVQSWLKAGGITNKKYTTVSEVLSDLTTLATLMSSTDAIDYLVTAKGWATEICSDSNAMADIGMNNYAANTLLADETWREAICNSTYKTSVLNVTNPNMTDNTHPYGVCFASSIYSSDYAEWKAFTGSINTRGWNCNSSEYNKLDQAYIGYEFTSAVKVCMIEFIYNTNSTSVSSSEIRVVANDNSADAWNVMSDVYTGTGTGQTERKIILNSYVPYKRIALKGSFYQGQRYFQICKATIYGRKDI